MIEALRRRKEIGAIAASGRHLAQAITAPISHHQDPCCVLEVGAGTGAFTRHILDRMKPGDAADIVELNEKFCAQLRSDVIEPWAAETTDRTARVIEGGIEEVDLRSAYQVVVCGLPFNMFPPEVSDRILRQLVDVLAPGGTLAFFEYVGLPRIRRTVPGPWQRHARQYRAVFQAISEGMQCQRRFIFWNVLPAWAVFLRSDSSPSGH